MNAAPRKPTKGFERHDDKREKVYMLDWRPSGGLCYIGKTRRLKDRVQAHRRGGLKAVFLKHGEPEIEILHECHMRAEAFVLEAWEIRAHGTLRRPGGYNGSLGAEGRCPADLMAWTEFPEFPFLSERARRAWEWLVGRGPGPDGRRLFDWKDEETMPFEYLLQDGGKGAGE